MRLRQSFWALLGQSESETPEAVLERVREAIQATLAEQLGREGQQLKHQVHYARDLEALWYLRPEIMNAIAARRGETTARRCLLALTALFKDHHPGASARSSRFGGL